MSYSMFGRWADARNIALRGALVFITLLSVANAATFTAQDASPVTCAGNLTIEKGGVVRCSDGASLLSSCSGDVVIDTKGVIRCPAVVGLPVCTLAAAPSSIAPGASSLLTATCNPLASSYVWTGVPTSFGSGAAGLVYPTATTTYTVKGVSSTGQQGVAASKTVTVTAASTTPTTPPSCSLSQQAGAYPGSTYLVSSCSPAATSYGWSGNANYNGSGCSTSDSNCLVNPSTTTTYSMTPSNAAGQGSMASITVTKSAVCTLTPSPASIYLGQSSTLTASCSPAADTYTWSAPCNTDAVGNSCVVWPASTGTASYTVVGTAAGTGASSPVTANVTVMQPTCTVTASPSTVGTGGTSTLTASCSPTATGYTWTGGTCESTTANPCIVTPALTTSYRVTGTAGNTATSAPVTVTVVAPYCTLTANPASIAPGGSSTLTAYCSPDATGYTWSDPCNSNPTPNTCTVSPGSTKNDYKVTGTVTNTATSDPATVFVLKPSCTLAANPATVTAGAPSSTLTASCSPAATEGYNWSDAGCSAASATCTVTPAAETTYTVAGINLAGTGDPASKTVSISTTPAGCQVADVTWASGLAAYGGNGGTPLQRINGGEMKAWRITLASQSRAAMMSYSQCVTHFSVSANACEWGTPALAAANCTTGGIDNSITVQTSDQPPLAGACVLQLGGTYYFNVRPDSDSVQNCSFYLSY